MPTMSEQIGTRNYTTHLLGGESNRQLDPKKKYSYSPDFLLLQATILNFPTSMDSPPSNFITTSLITKVHTSSQNLYVLK